MLIMCASLQYYTCFSSKIEQKINDKLITWIDKSLLNLLNKIFNKSSFNTTADTFSTQIKCTTFLPERVTSKTAMNEKATAFDTEKNKQTLLREHPRG